MKIIKFAVSLTLAGLLLAMYGLVFGPTDPPSVAAASSVSIDQLDPIHGLANLDEVVALFAARTEAQPLDYLSRTQLGAALNAKARSTADLALYDEAETALKAALDINPTWQPAQLALASTLHSQHRFDEARRIATDLVAADPSSLSALALLGDTNLELGAIAEARVAYERLAAAERSAPAVSRLARLALVTGDASHAVELATEAQRLSEELALRPNDRAFYWFQLGRMQFETGAVQSAVATYRTALTVDPGHGGATESLAFTQAALGNHGEAIDLYQSLIQQGAAPDLHGALADSLRAVGKADEANEQDQLGFALAADTIDDYPAERRHLVSFFVTRDASAAVRLAREDLAERQDAGAFDTLAWALFAAGDIDEAAQVIASAGREDPPLASMLYHRAAVAASIGDEDEALRLVELALANNPFFHPTEAADAHELAEQLRS